jgi:hypothetical protein
MFSQFIDEPMENFFDLQLTMDTWPLFDPIFEVPSPMESQTPSTPLLNFISNESQFPLAVAQIPLELEFIPVLEIPLQTPLQTLSVNKMDSCSLIDSEFALEKQTTAESSIKRRKRDRSNRMDVPCKKIIRTFRNFFFAEIKRMRFRSSDPKRQIRQYRDCLIEVLELNNLLITDKIVFYLSALLYKRDSEKALSLIKPDGMTLEECLSEIRFLQELKDNFSF